MGYTETQRERSEAYEARKQHGAFFPLDELLTAMARRRIKNEEVIHLAERIQDGDLPELAEWVQSDSRGKKYLRLPDFRRSNEGQALFESVHGLQELIHELDRDLTLSGKRSYEIREFQMKREGIAKEVRDEMIGYAESAVDYNKELVGKFTDRSVETPEMARAYETIQTFAQSIVERLFIAANLSQFRPVVRLTRSGEQNAFVFSTSAGQVQEFLASAQTSGEPVELPIFVNIGLVKQLESEDELAGVLAHEFSHLFQPAYLSTTEQSQQQRLEYDADAGGMRLADAAGFNPRGILDVFRRFGSNADSLTDRALPNRHPPINNRITELEKLFHNPDLPLPNAAQERREYTKEIRDALKHLGAEMDRIKAERQALLIDMAEAETRGVSERKLQESPPEAYLLEQVHKNIEALAKERRRGPAVEQELAHNILGFRSELLDAMKVFLLTLQLKENERVRYTHRLNCERVFDRYSFPRKMETLEIPRDPESYLHREHGFEDRPSSNKYAGSIDNFAEQVRVNPSHIRAGNLEDWLDVHNEDVGPFWNFILQETPEGKALNKEELSQEERLGIIHGFLRKYMFQEGYHQNPLFWVQRETMKEREVRVEKTVEDTKEEKSRLTQFGPQFRAHERKERERAENEYEIQKVQDWNRETIFDVKESSASLPSIPPFWYGEVGDFPKPMRQLFELEREGYREALRTIFEKEMGDPIEDGIIEYIANRLPIDKGSQVDRAYDRGLLAGISETQMTITFFDKAVSVLSSKSLKCILGISAEGDRNQWGLRRELAALIAFGLVPQTSEEEKIREDYLRRMELDVGLAGDGVLSPVYLGDFNPQEDGGRYSGRFDFRYVREDKSDKKEDDKKQKLQLTVENMGREALTERMWSEYGGAFKTFVDSGRPLTQSSIAEFSAPDIRERDMDIGRMAITRVFRREHLSAKKFTDRHQELAERLSHIATALRSYINLSYNEGALPSEQIFSNLNNELAFHKDRHHYAAPEKGKWGLMERAIDYAAEQLIAEFPDFFEKADAGVAWKLVQQMLVQSTTVADLIERAQKAYSLRVGRDKEKPFAHVTGALQSIGGAFSFTRRVHASDVPGTIDWFSYHSKEVSGARGNLPEHDMIRFEDVEQYLRMLAEEHPVAEQLIEEIGYWRDEYVKVHPKRYDDLDIHGSWMRDFDTIVNDLKILALGTVVPFTHFDTSNPEHQTRLRRFWRLAAELYKDEWKNIEQIKRIDEQLAHWEWEDTENNPIVRSGFYQDKKSKEIKVRRPCKISDEPLVRYLRSQFGHDLGNVYKVDRKHLDGVVFSWPLFMQDVWDGADIAEKLNLKNQSDETPKHENKRALFNLLVAELKADIEAAIADPNNLPDIEAMESGFFKEFIINEKMKRAGVSSLEEIEQWLPHLEQRPHEATERNQVHALLENERFDIADKRKKEIAEEVIRANGYGWLLEHYLITIETKSFGLHLQEEECRVKLTEQNAWKIYERDEKGKRKKDKKGFEMVIGDPPEDYETVRDNFLPRFYRAYDVAVREEAERGRSATLPSEADVLVFSDHVVEHEKSRLEIGPAYRLRWVSQPLMDWHSEVLAQSGKDIEHLFERVENALPDAHPLRDVFAFNQLAVELWNMIQGGVDGSVLSETGAALAHTDIDLKDALKEYPLYHDISFLKTYHRYHIDGFAGLARRMSPQFADQIIAKMEHYYNNVLSEEGKIVVRKMILEVEKAAVWPRLREDRKKDPDVFGAYINRIERLYPEPTFERDDILETIGMELAHTPEEIKRVWALRYAEMVRWPEQEEQKSVGRQFDAFEKLKMGVATLAPEQRAAYVVWFLGGETPLSESLVAAQKAISLDNRKELFWSMSAIERRHLLYEICTQDKGIFEARRGTAGHDSSHLWKEWGGSEDMIDYVSSELFELTFGENLLDVEKAPYDETNRRGREALKIIFQGLFRHQKDAARRTELLANIAEAMGDARKENRELDTGELMVLLLEQAGVIGIKAGQVLSEIPRFLPENIRQSLGNLKDKASEFSKRGVLAYLEAGGWLQEKDKKLLELKHTEAAASIKQVNRLEIELGGERREAVAKAKRPSIDKNFVDDVEMLGKILQDLQNAHFEVPGYLLPEVEMVVREELDFLHEVENQRTLGTSLTARKAQMDVWFGDEQSAVPLTVTAPLGVGEVHYPNPEIDVDIGLIVEEYVTGLSLKDLQRYKKGIESGDGSVLEEMRKKIEDKYGTSRVTEIQEKIRTIDLDHFQAELGLELLRQIVRGGAFHADLHSGNFFLDFTPSTGEGELHEARGIFLDTGAMGFSHYDAMPEYLQKDAKPRVDNRDAFRSFLSALFASNMKYDIIGQIVHRFTGLNWNAEYLAELVGTEAETGSKVKKIFYSVLEQAGKNLDQQFRYFLKAVATGADHLDKLKTQVASELASGGAQNRVMKKLAQEQLLDFNVII